MERLSTHDIEPILERIRNGDKGGRLRNFAENGTQCVCCGIEGEFFAKERHEPEHDGHFNLYAMRDGNEVLMTKDHIVPKSKGGANCVENYQPMCATCNQRKGDACTIEDRRRGKVKA